MDLTDAFGLRDFDCVAIAGGGGKTTIMYRLAREALARGRTAIAGGTTRFTPPHTGPMPPAVTLEPNVDPVPAVLQALESNRAVTATTGRGDKGRYLPLSTGQVDAIVAARVAGLVVLEADGSRNRPFKAPGEHEPVVPESTTVLIYVVGLDALGGSLTDELVHRPERAAELAGVQGGGEVTPEVVAAVLWHAEGGRKGLPNGARWIAVLNKAEGKRRAGGEAVAHLLLKRGADTVALTAAEAPDPVVAVLHGEGTRRQ